MSWAPLVILAASSACGFEIGTGFPDGPPPDHPPDVMVMLGACDAVEIDASAEHTCARTGDGSVFCWGRSEHGQVGALPLENRCAATAATQYCSPSPRKASVTGAIGLAAGQHHTCATTATNTYCWGLNLFGQYGDGSTTDLSPPGIIAQRVGSTKVDAGIFHTCSLGGGRVKCSGKNDMGEVGDNTMGQQSTAVEVFEGATSIGVGGYTSCAVDVNADLWCWGRNDYKQIDNSQLARRAPTKVLGVIAAQVVAGLNHICATTTNDLATCWGSNVNGQLGDGMTTPSPVPAVTVAVSRVKELAAGPYHTCARDDVGGVWCFGEGYTPVPTKIGLARPALSITAGSRHDCAVTDDHQIWCWGDQDFGQLGNGIASTVRSAAPQQAKLCP